MSSHIYIVDVSAEQLVEQDTTQTTIINSIVAMDTGVLHLIVDVSLYHHGMHMYNAAAAVYTACSI